MMQRREFVSGLAALAVVGFDPVRRSWIPAAHAAPPVFANVPALEGELIYDPAVLADKSTDAGNLVHKLPIAVLRPRSALDIAKMVRFCRKHRVQVAARGQGHTTYGQSLVAGGLIVDMSSLSRVHAIGEDYAEIDAGVLWRDLLLQSVSRGLTPPVLTGFLGLSIGGTLSVGGISSGNRRGAQVDHVRELEVVTGRGDIVRCSERRHPDLFLSVLAGLGQCAIITRAVVDLVPASPQVRVYQLPYYDNATFFADLRALLARNEFDDLFTLWFPDGAGSWIYQLNAVKYFEAAAPPDDSTLLRGLSYDATNAAIGDTAYQEYALRVDVAIDFFRSIGLWDDVLHPWFDVFLPDDTVEQYVGNVLPTLTPEDVGMAGFMLLFPQKRSTLRRPLLRVPKDEWVYLFDILTAAPEPGPNPEFAQRMLARNRRLFEQARAAGGTRYPIGSLDFTKLDWIFHYLETYLPFAAQKHRFDPDKILTPGPGIFR